MWPRRKEKGFLGGLLFQDKTGAMHFPMRPPNKAWAVSPRRRIFPMLGILVVIIHRSEVLLIYKALYIYKSLQILLGRTQAGPCRTIEQKQGEISRNHTQTFFASTMCTGTSR